MPRCTTLRKPRLGDGKIAPVDQGPASRRIGGDPQQPASRRGDGPAGSGATRERSAMSRTDGLYTAVQRRLITEILKLATSDNKKNIVRAFELAERITPDNHKYEMRFVREKVETDHPALNIARHVINLTPKCRDGFINAFVFNCLLRGSQKRQDFNKRDRHPDAVRGAHEPDHALQPHLRGLLRRRLLARQRHDDRAHAEHRRPGQRHGRLPVHDPRRRALRARGPARLLRRQLRRLLPDLHQRHAARRRDDRAYGRRSATWRPC